MAGFSHRVLPHNSVPKADGSVHLILSSWIVDNPEVGRASCEEATDCVARVRSPRPFFGPSGLGDLVAGGRATKPQCARRSGPTIRVPTPTAGILFWGTRVGEHAEVPFFRDAPRLLTRLTEEPLERTGLRRDALQIPDRSH